jgi:hypothetical protein
MAEAIIYVGIPGIGKSTHCKENFFKSHVRINRDMLRRYDFTRNVDGIHHDRKMNELITVCVENKIDIAVDNNNFTVEQRKALIAVIREWEDSENPYTIKCIFMKPDLDKALAQNKQRDEKEIVPDSVVKNFKNILVEPTVEEGFDSIEIVE